MISLPKPRSFWDYALFTLVMTGALLFMFWLEASDAIGWSDAALAVALAVLCVLVIVLARRGEKAAWIGQPTLYAYLLIAVGASGFMFGAIYTDTFLFHRNYITPHRLRHDILLAVVLTAFMLWSFRGRPNKNHKFSD